MQQLSSKTITAEQEKSKIHHTVNAEEKEKPVESGNFPQSRKECGEEGRESSLTEKNPLCRAL